MNKRLGLVVVLFILAILAVVFLTPLRGKFFKSEVIVAVLDTGVDTQAGLNDRLLQVNGRYGWNFVEGNAVTEDLSEQKHGTLVAKAIALADPKIKLLIVRVAQHGGGTGDGFAKGVHYGLEHGADVINISSGLVYHTPEMDAAVAAAATRGVPIVTAAGVGVPNPFAPVALSQMYPQAYPGVIVVGKALGTNQPDIISNFGPALDVVVAPLPNGNYLPEEINSHGSSFAAAIVSGAVAKYRLAHPSAAPAEIRAALRHSTIPPYFREEDRAKLDRLGSGTARLVEFQKIPNDGYFARMGQNPFTLKHEIEINSSEALQGAKGTYECAPDATPRPAGELELLSVAPANPEKGRLHYVVADFPQKTQGCKIKLALTPVSGGERQLSITLAN
ncbi:MAG: S8 family serine peptidase [Bacteriovoracia bacterium]